MAGSRSSVSLPHTLQTAHTALSKELRQGIDSFERNSRYANAREICLNVERFVYELLQEPAWQAELERRAGLVVRGCGLGSEFNRAMGAAWKAYRTLPQKPFGPKLSGEKLEFRNLKGARRHPVFLSEVVEMRRRLERIIDSGLLGRQVKAAFQDWLGQCRKVHREAERLEVDGCWYLYYAFQGAQPSPSDDAEYAKGFVGAGGIAGVILEDVLVAADSLVAWIWENPSRVNTERLPSGGEAGPQRPGGESPETGDVGPDTPTGPAYSSATTKKSKRSTVRGEGREKLVAAWTKHHKYADGSCLNQEPIGNNELARLAQVSISTASMFFKKEFGGHPNYRMFCRDVTRLVTALKLLNQEFSPYLLFGGKPPGEDDRGDDE